MKQKTNQKSNERNITDMNNGGDAAEQIVRLSLEGFEVAAKLSGSAAKNIALLLVSVLKEEQKTKGKTRLTNMIKSGKELKVFSIPNKDLRKFTEQAKRYGVLYCVLRDKSVGSDNAPVDIIARAEDASKIQRIVERFELGQVDKGEIIGQAVKDVAERESKANEVPAKSKGEIIMEESVQSPMQKERNSMQDPTTAETDKNPPSRQNSEPAETQTDKGVADSTKPSVREKLNQYKAKAKEQKEAERFMPEMFKSKTKQNGQTVHKQPKKKKKKTKVR